MNIRMPDLKLFDHEILNVTEKVVFGPVPWHAGSFGPGLKFVYK